jgi:hypothetical protein
VVRPRLTHSIVFADRLRTLHARDADGEFGLQPHRCPSPRRRLDFVLFPRATPPAGFGACRPLSVAATSVRMAVVRLMIEDDPRRQALRSPAPSCMREEGAALPFRGFQAVVERWGDS